MKDKDNSLDVAEARDEGNTGSGIAVFEKFEPDWKREPSRSWFSPIFRWRRRDDDDDDPPPCPAVIMPMPRLPPSGAELELEAA